MKQIEDFMLQAAKAPYFSLYEYVLFSRQKGPRFFRDRPAPSNIFSFAGTENRIIGLTGKTSEGPVSQHE